MFEDARKDAGIGNDSNHLQLAASFCDIDLEVSKWANYTLVNALPERCIKPT